jgi:hypothetical protein
MEALGREGETPAPEPREAIWNLTVAEQWMLNEQQERKREREHQAAEELARLRSQEGAGQKQKEELQRRERLRKAYDEECKARGW